MHLAPGTRLGSYEILGPLGAGGMGEVYRAHDAQLDRTVAIKLLPATLAGSPEARERLRREALAAAALDHPYACKVFEIGRHGDELFLVMEFVTGETLHERLKRGPVPLDEALRLSGEVAEALEAAHARGILHRDLKPSNIMLTAQGHVKVMDFGLAKRMSESATADAETAGMKEAPLTSHGAVLGTPDYMSPEQMKALPLDARSDLFSLGVILAEMLGARHPFRKASTVETFSAVLNEPPELARDTPPRVQAVLRRLLAKQPAERYASAGDLRAELARLAEATRPGAGTAPAAHLARQWWTRAALVALLALAGFGISRSPLARRVFGAGASGAAPGAIRSLAVLPLDNYSGDPGQDYFAEGMTDELTARLATISRLRVISRGSAMQFRGSGRPPAPEIARLLDVDALVEGSVTRSGDRVRITAELIDARADRHLWARSFERKSSDVLELQADLAEAIADEINVQLTPNERSRFAAAPHVNPEAYDAYLKGRYFFNRPSDENLKKAIARFEEAVRLSPEFAPAYSGLSDAYLWAGYNEGFMTATEARVHAKAAAEKAVALDQNSAEAQTSLAVFHLFYDYDWAGSEREFRKAIALNPNYAYAHDQFGLVLAFQGRFDEAIREGRRAAELDPLSPQIPIDNAIAYINRRDYDGAHVLARRAAELDSTFFFPPMLEGWIEAEAGNPRAAIPWLEKAAAMDAPAFVTAWLAYAYGAAGERDKARSALAELKRISLNGEPTAFNLALVSLGLGERAKAVAYLEQARQADTEWLGWLKLGRIFDPLRSEPGFQELLRRIGFGDQAAVGATPPCARSRQRVFAASVSSSFATSFGSCGSVRVSKRATTRPSGPTRNLVKFQPIAPSKPDSFVSHA